MKNKVLYLGDTALDNAARYLGGVLRHLKLAFDYLPSHKKPTAAHFASPCQLYVVSDYAAKNWPAAIIQKLEKYVASGSGLLMIGGWGSFHGLGAGYEQHVIGEMLPVHLLDRDDRRQGAVTYRIIKQKNAGVFQHFDFRPAPGLAGFNRLRLKKNATELLSVETIQFDAKKKTYYVAGEDPLFVTGRFGAGLTAACATDLAPHWAGGLVDWGPKRMSISAGKGISAEVGETYVAFVSRMIRLFF